MELSYNPSLPLLGIYLNRVESLSWGYLCTFMFPAVLFIIIKAWKPHKYPLTDEWLKKRWYMYIQPVLFRKKEGNCHFFDINILIDPPDKYKIMEYYKCSLLKKHRDWRKVFIIKIIGPLNYPLISNGVDAFKHSLHFTQIYGLNPLFNFTFRLGYLGRPSSQIFYVNQISGISVLNCNPWSFFDYHHI